MVLRSGAAARIRTADGGEYRKHVIGNSLPALALPAGLPSALSLRYPKVRIGLLLKKMKKIFKN